MTMPDERFRAVLQAEKFLQSLCNVYETPRVPKDIRQQARGILRHYPNHWDMKNAASCSPDTFAERMEDVNRLFKQYEENKKDEDKISK